MEVYERREGIKENEVEREINEKMKKIGKQR
jgi:hypothetical protein